MSILRMNMTEEQKKNMWASIYRAEGIEEGRAEGHAEGREEGRAEGRAELISNMISAGASWEFIENVTGMSRETIEAL